jgi:hypothetical protein
MKLKNYQFAPGVIECYPCRWRLSADAVLDALLLAVAVAMTAVSASIGWMLGGVL